MNRSESIAQLAAALSAAQGEMHHATKDSENPHFRSHYASLASVLDACRTPLAKNGLALIQTPRVCDGRVVIETMLAHKSGEWVSDELSLKPQQDSPQSVGSAITYGRRYGAQAMLGIAPDDDDGEAAEGRQPQQARQPAKHQAKHESNGAAEEPIPADAFQPSDDYKWFEEAVGKLPAKVVFWETRGELWEYIAKLDTTRNNGITSPAKFKCHVGREYFQGILTDIKRTGEARAMAKRGEKEPVTA